jgi:hypothetical protein
MRYVIQNAQGALYTQCEIVGNRDSIEADGQGNKFVHQRHVLKPLFTALAPIDASKFGTEQDAIDMMTHTFLEDPKAFDGCKVVPAAV